MILAIRYMFLSCPIRISALIAIIVLQGLIPALNIFMTGEIINGLQTSATSNNDLMVTIGLWCLSLLGIQLMQPLVNLLQGDVTEIATSHFSGRIMQRMNSSFSLSLFDNKERYEQLEFLKKEAAYRPLNFIICLIYTFRALVMAAGLLVVLVKYSGIGSALCALSVIPLILVNLRIERQYWENLLKNSKDSILMRYVYGLSMDKSYLQEIRLYGLGKYLLEKFTRAAKSMHERMHKQRIRALLMPIPASILSLLMLFAGVYLFLNTLRHSHLAVSALVMVFQSIVMMKSHLDAIANYGANIKSTSTFFETFHFFITDEIEPVVNGEVLLPHHHPFSIHIAGLYFQYPGRNSPALNGVDLSLQAGEKVAILGDNGSGKTTLIKLLLRMYAAQHGSISVSGVALENLDIEHYRQQIATVFQEYGKYEFSVGENIALSNYETETHAERLEALIKQVKFPYALNTGLGKQFGGDELSIGQWQKLAIARALFRDANLFIFDEFSSSLDPETEHQLFMDILALNTTVIAVTHRLGNIKAFDRIVVMSEGKVIENGDFTSLMNQRGKFYDMWHAQFQSVMSEAV